MHQAFSRPVFRTTPPKRRCSASRQSHAGLTLVELVTVMVVLAALAAVAVPLIGNRIESAQETTTNKTLAQVRDAIALFWQDDDRSPKQVPTVHQLFVDPTTGTTTFRFDATYQRGWRGPYLSQSTGFYEIGLPDATFTASYGSTGDSALIDGWGNPVVVQNPGVTNGLQDVRVVSAGADGVIDISPTTFSSALNDSNDGDDVYVAFTLR